MKCREIVEAAVAEEVRPTRAKVRQPAQEITWEDMTDFQRAIVKAGNRPGTPIPPGTRAERLTCIYRMLSAKG